MVQALHVRLSTALLAVGFILSQLVSAQGATPPSIQRSKLYKTSRARLAIARARGDKDFRVVIAAADGKAKSLAAAILRAGGRIETELDDVDFLDAEIPLGAVEAIASSADVVTIDADASITTLDIDKDDNVTVGDNNNIALRDNNVTVGDNNNVTLSEASPASVTLSEASAASEVEAPTGPNGPTPAPSPTATPDTRELPLLEPYLPGGDMGTDAFKREHPTYDGRGVTVGVIDSGPDFLLPELQHAKDLAGHDIRKMYDMRAEGNIDTDIPGYSAWIKMDRIVTSTAGNVVVDGTTYRVPHDGTYRFGFITNNGYFTFHDAIGDSKKKEPVPLYAVLWDDKTNQVWVDSNNDKSFAEKKPMTDYKVNGDYGTFARTPKEPGARDSVGFVVQTDLARHAVAVELASGSHASGVAGTIAGVGFLGGKFDGIAPGARLAFDRDGSAAGIIESIARFMRDPEIDLVCVEIISPLSYGFHDGRFTESIIFQRLVRRYRKPIVIPGNNLKGMSQVSEGGIPEDVMAVGAYQSKASYHNDGDVEVKQRDNLHWVSGFGPAGNGALRPNFLAPSGYVSLGLGYESLPGRIKLRPGYTVFGGTSQATPTASAAIALLLSAAKQEHMELAPSAIIASLMSTARYLPNIPAYESGTGLIQVDRAWAALRAGEAHEPRVTVQAPVRTATSWALPTPNRGPGLFEREGWRAGMSATRTLDVKGTAAEHLSAEILGNDGTFSSDSALDVAPGRVTHYAVKIAPRASGAHSAILRLRDAKSHLVVADTLLTIVAADDFTAGRPLERTVNMAMPDQQSTFVRVPAGSQGLVVTLSMNEDAPYTGLRVFTPDAVDPLNVSNNLLVSFPLVKGTKQLVVPAPPAGVYEVELLRSSTTAPIPADAKVAKVDVSIALVKNTVTWSGGGALNVKNEGTAFSGLQIEREEAQVQRNMGTVRAGGQQVYEIKVPANAVRLAAKLEYPSATDVDLYLFDCSKKCMIVNKSAWYGGPKSLIWDRPAEGTWKIVVDGYRASRNGTPFGLTTYLMPGPGPKPAGSRTMATISVLGNAPGVYYNEGGVGRLPEKPGLIPVPLASFELPSR